MAARKFLSGVDLASQQIKNVADGSAATDAVNLQQLQAYVKGLTWKAAVRVASTANITLTAPGTTIDGVTMANNDRVLLKNQTTTSANGLYVFNGSGSTMTRCLDAAGSGTAPDGVQTLTGGLAVYVESGTANADTAWTLTTDDPIVVDTTALAFAQFGGGQVYTASSGLQLSANAFSVKLPASSGLVADGTGTYIDKTLVMTRFAVNVGDGASTAIAVTHNLGTKDVHVALYDNSTFVEVLTDTVHTSTTVVTLNFAVAPASAAYRCVVIG